MEGPPMDPMGAALLGGPLPPPPPVGGLSAPPGGPMPPPEQNEQEIDWESLELSNLVEKVELGSAERQQISDFLSGEIDRAISAFEPTYKRAQDFRERYAEYRRKRDFPWPNCSNTEVSMTQPYVDQIVGRNFRVLYSTDPPILVEPMPGTEKDLSGPDVAKQIQDYTNAKTLQDPTFKQSLYELVLEAAITGTGIAKVYWDHREREIQVYETYVDEEFDQPEMPMSAMFAMPMTPPKLKVRKAKKTLTEFQGSRLETFRIEDFLFTPESANDPNAIQNAIWIAQKFYESVASAKGKAQGDDALYDPKAIAKIEQDAGRDPNDRNALDTEAHFRNIGQIAESQKEDARNLCLYEVHIRMPFGSLKGQELVIVYHRMTETILSIRNSVFFHGKRPFVRLPYWPLSCNFFGRGIPEKLWYSQIGANDIFNAGVDALVLANTGVWKASRQTGIKPGKNDRVWAGRIIILDDPAGLERVDTGSPSNFTMDFVEKVDKLGQRAASVTESLTGGESAQGNRETAEGAAARQGSATPMFDIILDCMRSALAEIAEMFLSNCQQFAYGEDSYGRDQDLKLPLTSVIGKFRFRVVASSVSANPEVRKTELQHFMATIQPVFEGLGQKVMGLAQAPPPAQIVIKKDLEANFNLARQLTQAFSLPGAENLIPTWAELGPQIEQAVQQFQQQQQQKPPEIADAVMRHITPNFINMEPEEQIQVLEKIGIKPAALRERAAQSGQPMEPPFGAGMAGPPGGGAAGFGGPPPGMPGLPVPSGPPMGGAPFGG